MGNGLLSVAAHTIGHRTVEINDIETNNNNLIGEIENDGFTWGTGTGTVDVRGVTDNGCNSNSDCGDFGYLGVTSVLNTEDSDSENSTERQLVVVAVRGSVTPLDWVMDY